MSIKTAQDYVSSIRTKLQVADRAQAIVRGAKRGLGRSKSGWQSDNFAY